MAKNTPAQELALERWQKCSQIPTVRLKEIRPSGEIWVFYEDPGRFADWQACNRAAYVEQQKAGGLGSVQSKLTEQEARELVRHAYFTNAPPPTGTYLTALAGSPRPPEVREFTAGSPVTFFYGITQVGRALNIQSRWSGPNGNSKSFTRVMDQTGRPGSWTWQTQTMEGSEMLQRGEWAVDLVLDGHRVGTYRFVVR